MAIAQNKHNGIELRTQSPQAQKYFIFDKDVKNIHWKRDSIFTKQWWKIGSLHIEKWNSILLSLSMLDLIFLEESAEYKIK